MKLFNFRFSLFQCCIWIVFFVLTGCISKPSNELQIVLKDTVVAENPSQVTVSVSDNKTLGANLKVRGGYSRMYPKNSYELSLDSEVSLYGLAADDDWILNANYIDKTFLRHTVSFSIFRSMSINNLSPKFKYVDLYINQDYQGLYVLMEKMDKSTLLAGISDSSSFIFKEPHLFRSSYLRINQSDTLNFHHQTFPNTSKVNKRDEIDTLRSFIINASDSLFSSHVFQIFDMQNIIDWNILLLLSNNSDGILKNFYMYKVNSQTPIRIAIWDYDHSFGRDGNNELNLNTRKLDVTRSILFKRLYQFSWYQTMLAQRWLSLNESDVLSLNGLQNRFLAEHQIIVEQAIKNESLWSNSSSNYFDKNNLFQEMGIISDFLELKHEELDFYFQNILLD
jgi:hypothetical protein